MLKKAASQELNPMLFCAGAAIPLPSEEQMLDASVFKLHEANKGLYGWQMA